MKALTLVAVGGLQHLRVQELPEPTIRSPGQVLIRVQAIALNRLDLFVAEGLPGVNYSFPHVVGSDGTGIVQEVGAAVSQVRPGDRVMINPTLSCGSCPACLEGEDSLCASLGVLGEHSSGTAAEYIVVPAANLARVPEGMPWPQAAAFSLATLTAWRMLTTRARVQQGDTILIWGIGGGVALAALQIAGVLGARTIVTSGVNAKLEAARALGADAGLNHASVDVAGEVRKLTEGRGADVVVDSAGEQSWQKSLRCLRRGGRLVVCGATTGPIVSLDLRRLFWHQWSILGSTLGNRREYGQIVRLAEEGKLWPVVDQVVPLGEAIAAFGRLQRGEQVGKLVIEVAQ
ncbi:MAG TPA: zinc-binding dehydrogenase [Gemmatimonadales bacterium]|jgi:NADPH:quinone reductase-like Zn-dependent oxidoreductase